MVKCGPGHCAASNAECDTFTDSHSYARAGSNSNNDSYGNGYTYSYADTYSYGNSYTYQRYQRTPTSTPALSGLTYNGGTPFVNGTNLISGRSYTITAQANATTQSVVFKKDGTIVKTDSATPFDFTCTPSVIGTHTFVATPWSSTGGTGSSGASITVSFNVVAASPTPTPTPTTPQLQLRQHLQLRQRHAYSYPTPTRYSYGTPTATPTPAPPNAPSNLTGSVPSRTQVNLLWTDNANNENGFTLQRADGGVGLGGPCGTFVTIQPSLPANTTRFNDTGLSANHWYCYRVRAFNGAGHSSWSNTLSIRTH